ncbi:MAG: transcriptional regulator, partial [Deltaproteobacteria bacterium]|nr:transcriptional regulator [Deltaproteobacteria bacterium]
MKLRTIILLLCLLTFLSAWAGGYFYYTSLKDAAFKEAERQVVTRVKLLTRTLSALLSENIKPVGTLAGISEVKQFLSRPDGNSYRLVNTILDHFRATLGADVCYLMEVEGTTVASSNRNAPDSFVGQNFSFRPYFRQAIRGEAATYLALGKTSGKRGAYFSHPVYVHGRQNPAGIVVLKVSIDLIEKELVTHNDEIVLVADPKGVIFISNRQELRFKSLWHMLPKEISELEASLQFGRGPWSWAGLEFTDRYAKDTSGNEYLMGQAALENYAGWRVVHLRNLNVISKSVSQTLIRKTGPLILTLCLLIGLAVFFLYQRATHEIDQRKSAEKVLRQSEERYRFI